jgi:hypothetical protein
MSFSEKLAKIQAVIERATLDGERQAAALAMERLLKRQSQLPIEFRVTLPSIWQKKLFVALCHKYGLKTYRYHRQKHTTTMTRLAPALMNELLWPEYKKYSAMLQELIEEVLASVIGKIGKEEEETVISGEIGPIHELNALSS